MTEFKPDCIINLHVEAPPARGGSARLAWSCSITHAKHGRLVLAEKLVENTAREEVELSCLLFGLRQALRFLQEKVEVTATFPVETRLPRANSSSRGGAAALKSKADIGAREALKIEVAKAWEQFRLRRTARMPGSEADILRAAAEHALRAK